jgi:hypothetical protein
MAAEKFEEQGVLGSIPSEKRRQVTIYLKNPITGHDLEDDIVWQEYGPEAREERERRNQERPYTRKQLLTWASSVFKLPVTPINDGELADLESLRREAQPRSHGARPLIMVASICTALLALIGGVFLLTQRQPSAPFVLRQRQLTANSSENAVVSGAISFDSKRLAYSDPH